MTRTKAESQQRRLLRVFSARGVLVRPDGGGIQDGAGFIVFDGPFLEQPFPDTGLGAAGEPVVHGLPGAEALG
jgi:hypothetical protein